MDEHKHTFVADVDQDGALELYTDFTTNEKWGGEVRSPGSAPAYYSSGQREIVIYSGRKHAEPPFRLSYSQNDGPGTGFSAPKEDTVMLHDLDGDGHLDVIVIEPCRDGGTCDMDQRERTIYLYDPRLDRWIKGARTKDAAAAAGAGSDSAQPAGATQRDLPESLDRAMISEGIAKVKGKVMSCADKSPAKGMVKVTVKVDPDGHVTGVTVKSKPDGGLGDCVTDMVQKATFAKTQTGGSFSYPFLF